MNPEKDFSPEESLQLIRTMIDKTKHSMSNSSHFFLLWGWLVFIGCVLQYVLMVVVKYERHYLAWLVIPVAFVLHMYFMIRDKRKEQVQTFISEAISYLWMAIGIAFFASSVLFTRIGWQYSYPIMIMLYGIGTFVTGGIIKFKPLKIGGIACGLLMILCAFVGYQTQILVTAAALLFSYIIPGHMLNNHYHKTKTS